MAAASPAATVASGGAIVVAAAALNKSEEIVPPDGTPIPAGSAQFDLDALTPRPSDALPLRLTLTNSGGPLRIDLTPEQTLSLRDLA
jgi:hypothetical protein